MTVTTTRRNTGAFAYASCAWIFAIVFLALLLVLIHELLTFGMS